MVVRAVSRRQGTPTAREALSWSAPVVSTMVRRGEITEAAWEQIEPLLPENGRKGRRWGGHRTAVDGTLWKLRTGAPWRTLPARYGPWQTCFDRCNRWRRDGTRDRLLEHAQTKSDAVGEVGWEVSAGRYGRSRRSRPPARRGGQEASR